jgi:hypothetical protein
VSVPGWRSVDDTLTPQPIGRPDREAEWENATSEESFGCSECGWEGSRRQLEHLGNDGEPLQVPITGQLEIAA